MDKLSRLLRQVKELRVPVTEDKLEQVYGQTTTYVVLDPEDKLYITASPRETDIVVARQEWRQYVKLVEE
jgi:hypothetical protein